MPLLTTPSGRFGYFNSSSEVPFNPASLSAPLMTWFKGDAGLGRTWTNYGTNGGSAGLVNTSVTTVNGLNAVDFDNEFSYATFEWLFSGDSRAFFFAYRSKSTNPAQSLIIGEPQDPYNFALYTAYSEIGIVTFPNNPNIVGTTSFPTGIAVYGIAYAPSSAASNNYASLNGSNLSISSNAPSGFNDATYPTPVWINSFGGTPAFGTGMVLCELLCYNGVVTPTDATKVTDYLKAKWGVSVPPPYTLTEINVFFSSPGTDSGDLTVNWTDSGGFTTFTWTLYVSTDEYGTSYNVNSSGSGGNLLGVNTFNLIGYSSWLINYWYYFSIVATTIASGTVTLNTTPIQNIAF